MQQQRPRDDTDLVDARGIDDGHVGVVGARARAAAAAARRARGAVAWMSFPPPAGFSLAVLPEGTRRPVGTRTNIDPLPLPSFGREQPCVPYR